MHLASISISAVSHVLPNSGSSAGDVIAVLVAVAVFALLYWLVGLLARV
ncbi:MAG: hypothetical protein M3Z33_00190 [Actinomycetota bacterium]|nr:hypothetical protein [Actinomycetota bacterium]